MRRQAKIGWEKAQYLSVSCGGTFSAAKNQSSQSWVLLLPGTSNPIPPLIQQLLVLLLFKQYILICCGGFFFLCLLNHVTFCLRRQLSPYLFHPCQLVAKSCRPRKAGVPSRGLTSRSAAAGVRPILQSEIAHPGYTCSREKGDCVYPASPP